MIKKPFSLLIKPVSARCNLRCEYCFYLEKSNNYPKEKKFQMTYETLEKMISSYMALDQPIYSFGWQGGEPTLAGLDFFKKAIEFQKKYNKRNIRVNNSFQTNATLISEEMAEFFAENNFLLGVSLDGPDYLHNIHRKDIKGDNSYNKVNKAIKILEGKSVEFNILTLVNTSNVKHPVKVYNYLKNNNYYYHQYIPCVEFNETGDKEKYAITGKEWGNFMCKIFDNWINEDTKKISIRLFDGIIEFLILGRYQLCNMGGNCCNYYVVEYNGDIYPCDFFVEKQLKLGNINEHIWETFIESKKYYEFGQEKNDWALKCKNCKWITFCSGDCLKNRQKSNNLSYLCDGWQIFYEHTIEKFKELAKEVIKTNKNINNNTKLIVDYKFDRNGKCFCGSNRKYKYCHGYINN